MGLLNSFWTTTANAASGVGKTASAAFVSPSQTANTQTGSSTDPALTNSLYNIIITQQQDYGGNVGSPIIVVGAVPPDVQLNQNAQWKAPWGAGLVGSGNVGDIVAAATGNRLIAQALTMQVWGGTGTDMSINVVFELRAYSDVERDVMQPLRSLLNMTVPSINSTGFLISPGPVMDAAGLKQLGGQLATLGTNLTAIGVNTAKALADKTTVAAANNPSAMIAGYTTDGKKDVSGILQQGTNDAAAAVKASGLGSKKAIEDILRNKIQVDIGNWFTMKNVVVTDVQHTLKAQQPGANGGIMSATVSFTFCPMFAVTTDDVKTMLKSAPGASS